VIIIWDHAVEDLPQAVLVAANHPKIPDSWRHT